VPCYLHGTDYAVEVGGLGTLRVDVAYGGNFYAIVEPQEHFTDLSDLQPSDILRLSPRSRTRKIPRSPG
jgi:4-hydroxyproline epimerase